MVPQAPLREEEVKNWTFFEALPSVDRNRLSHNQVKDIQLLDPLFEFSGACAGCGETPYIKLLTQLFGDRLFIANATGCSSIYGGSLPTTPYSVNKSGRGPTWSNSLFEDNAEFGLGIRLALDQQKEYAEVLLQSFASTLGEELVTAILSADQSTEAGIEAQRGRILLRPREARQYRLARSPHPAHRGRLARPQERLAGRRRWLGLRHRLWRPRPRARLRREREGPRPRHRNVLQHRRPDVEVHTARRCCQVRRRRQA